MNKSKFNYKKFPKGNGVFLRVSSERAVFKATGEFHRTKKGYIAVPVKILAGTFVDFDDKEHEEGKGTLLLPGFFSEDDDFTNALNDKKIIGVVCEKNEKNGKYYFKAWTVIDDPEDVNVFVHDEEEKGDERED
jgi:hypothetical protein